MAEPDEEEWLLARERGEDVSHIPARMRARYEQLDKLIEALPERVPPAGWKQRVLGALDVPSPRSSSDALEALPPRSSSDALDATPLQVQTGAFSASDASHSPSQTSSAPAGSIAQSSSARAHSLALTSPARPASPPQSSPVQTLSSAGTSAVAQRHSAAADAAAHASAAQRRPLARSRRVWASAGAAAAIAIVVLVVVRGSATSPRRTEPIVTSEIRRGERPHRGGDVAVGDTLVVRAQADGPIELRVYGDGGEPLARCTETQGCAVERSGVHRRYALEVVLRSPGETRAVLFRGAAAIPEPRKDLDADLEAALAANVDAREVVIVHVQ
jgi:hypothetical protein